MYRTPLALALAALFAGLASTPTRAQCTTDRLSVDSAGTESNGDAGFNAPNVARNYMCADGHLVAFWTTASNLVANDTNGVSDVFVRNRLTNVTTRVSVDSNGVEGNGASTDPAFSADGRYVVFQSAASNLVPNDTNGKIDVFLRDLSLGITVRVSIDSSGVESDGDSGRPDISADGRFVAFHSKGTNLVANDTNGAQDVFVRDMVFAVTNCLSVDDLGNIGNLMSGNPSISATGRFVAFHSNANNLVANDTNGLSDVFVRDRGNFTTTRVSTNSIGDQGTFISQTPSISADGRYVAFSSAATNLVQGDSNNLFDVFVKDRATNVTIRASVSSTGAQGNNISQGNSISADGRFVAFVSSASNLVPNDTNGGTLGLTTDVFVRDIVNNATERLSVDSAGAEGNQAGSSFNVCVSADASTVAFYSGASNLAANDTNGFIDVFARSCGGPPSPGAFCSGDGTGTACPCNNNGLHGHGCENSFTTGGGQLTGSGHASVSSDTFTLAVSGLPASASALYFQGDQAVAAGAGTPFGDGLRCVGGAVQRIGARLSTAGGSQFGYAVPGDPLISAKGMVPMGTVSIRFYQVWYRNMNAFCTPDPYNLTNGLTVTWIP